MAASALNPSMMFGDSVSVDSSSYTGQRRDLTNSIEGYSANVLP